MSDNIFDLDAQMDRMVEPSYAINVPLPVKSEPSAGESLTGAMWRQNNIFGSYIEKKSLENKRRYFDEDPDFDWLGNVPPDMLMHADKFAGTKSLGMIYETARQIRKEQDDKGVISQYPIQSLITGFAVNLIDPTILLPGGTIYKNAKAGLNIAKSAASVGAAATVAATAQEAALYQTQLTRTVEESAYGVISSALLGSVLGGVGGRFAGGAIGAKAKADIRQTYVHGLGSPHLDSLSAMKVDPKWLKESDSIGAGMGRFFDKLASNFTPLNRLRNSPYAAAREFADLAYESNIVKKKYDPQFGNEARPQDVETQIRMGFARTEKALADYDDIYLQQAGIPQGPFRGLRSVMPSKGLNRAQFELEVSRALRNDDQHANPHVEQAAKLLREKVIDPWKDEAIALGMLPENVTPKTAASYFMRTYDRQKIKENPEAFKNAIRPWVTQKNTELTALQPVITSTRERLTNAKNSHKVVVQAEKDARKVRKALEGFEKKLDKELEILGKAEESINLKASELDRLIENRDKSLSVIDSDLEKIVENLRARKKPGIVGARKKAAQERAAIRKDFDAKAKKLKDEISRLKKKKDAKDKDISMMEMANKKDEARLKELKKKGTAEESLERIKAIEKELDDSVPFDLKDSDGNIRNVLDDDQIDAVLDQIYNNIIGRNEKKMLNPVLAKFASKGKTNPLNNRHFLIPDELIEDWTLNSPTHMVEQYSRAMIPTVELNKFARRTLDPKARSAKRDRLLIELDDLQESLLKATDAEKTAIEAKIAEKNLEVQAQELPPTPGEAMGEFINTMANEMENMKVGKSSKEAAKLEKKFERAKKDIEETFQILQGVYGKGPNVLDDNAAKVAGYLKAWNFIRLMGFMTISSLPDIGMHIMTHGPMAFLKDGLIPFLTNMKEMKLNKAMLQDMGLAIETLRGQRLKSFLDHEGTAFETGMFGRGLNFLTTTFGNAALMNQWQDMNHMIAGNMSIGRTLRAIDEWATTGHMSPQDRTRLNTLSVPEKHWKAIHDEWQKTGGKNNGAYYSNWGEWNVDSPEVAQAYQAFSQSIFREVNSTVIMPGLGDKPLWAQTGAGSLMFQFKSFLSAATNKVLIAGLSRNDANFYMGVASMLTLGAMSYVIASKLRKPDEEVDLSWGKLVKEAIDKSGLLGVFMEGFNMGEKLLGNDGVSRYQSRGVTGAFFGPSLGLVEDIAYLINKFSRSISDDGPNLTTKDAEKLMRLMPYQNMFYLYYLNRQVTNKAALGLGFEEP